uniref:mucoidy inhibitor MuiA family protein n=1 Tax=Allorhizocola rhizosphaerae TaxID=1872709 RepID=UPI000E3E2A1A
MTLVEAPITGVTVFPDRARVTRRGSVSLAAGEHRVLVGPLPTGLLHDSVRVSGQGPATVLGVDIVTRRQPQSLDPEVVEIEERLRAIADTMAAMDDADAIAVTREKFLGRITFRSAGTFATGDITAAGRFADDIEAQLTDVKQGVRRRARERTLLVKEREAAQRRLDDLRGRAFPDQVFAELAVEAGEEATIELELSYVTHGAWWHSSYDLRLVGEQLTLTWYGLVTQHTGEDWPECDLKLSTARPAGALEVPELDPWYLDRVRPMP